MAHIFYTMTIEELEKIAEDRIGFGMDVNNLESEVANKIGTGLYIAYNYNHSEGEVWRFVMFDRKEKAKKLAEHWASEWCTNDIIREWKEENDGMFDDASPEEIEKIMKEEIDAFNRLSAWDQPFRIGQSVVHQTTIGYAFVYDYINHMPLEQLRQFASCLFEFGIITGGEQDH